MNLKLEFKKEMEEEKLQKHVCACLCEYVCKKATACQV